MCRCSELGAPAVALAASYAHTCALLVGGGIRCRGRNFRSEIVYGHLDPIGDDEAPTSIGDVPVGAPVVQIDAENQRTSVVTDTGGVRCRGARSTSTAPT